MKSIIRYLLPFWIIFSACSCDKNSSGMKENPFENAGESSLKISYTSNADSVKLSWTVVEGHAFDSYRVTDVKGKNDISLPKDATSCCLTRIPYNEPVKISVAQISGGEKVSETTVSVVIDGVDHVFGKKIIQDNSGVTAGDGRGITR